jgi:hypothetical protein
VPRQFTIGWLRESELKHGRIAMFGFIGYIVHENGIRSPDGIANLVSTDLSAPAVWDAIPEIGKWQIVLFVGLMDIWRESKVGSSLHPPPSPPAPFAVPASFEPLRVSSPVPSSPVRVALSRVALSRVALSRAHGAHIHFYSCRCRWREMGRRTVPPACHAQAAPPIPCLSLA